MCFIKQCGVWYLLLPPLHFMAKVSRFRYFGPKHFYVLHFFFWDALSIFACISNNSFWFDRWNQTYNIIQTRFMLQKTKALFRNFMPLFSQRKSHSFHHKCKWPPSIIHFLLESAKANPWRWHICWDVRLHFSYKWSHVWRAKKIS